MSFVSNEDFLRGQGPPVPTPVPSPDDGKGTPAAKKRKRTDDAEIPEDIKPKASKTSEKDEKELKATKAVQIHAATQEDFLKKLKAAGLSILGGGLHQVELEALDRTKPTYRILLRDDSIYKGDCIESIPEGYGVEVFKRGPYALYRGDFHLGCFDGEGHLEKTDGVIYEGLFKGGRFLEGTMTLPDKYTYEGQFNHLVPHGQGTKRYLTGDGEHNPDEFESYMGNFANGVFDGEGSLKYRNGNLYEGNFREGEKHGKGIEYNVETQTVKEVEYTDGILLTSEESNPENL